ncbi:hypothetical protein CA830_16210, partial [Burkholderia multivorans]
METRTSSPQETPDVRSPARRSPVIARRAAHGRCPAPASSGRRQDRRRNLRRAAVGHARRCDVRRDP